MNLISQIFLIILIACFTGTVSLGFWRVFQPLLLKRDPRPVSYTHLDVYKRQTDERANNDWQHAYVACFPGTAQDETKYAKQVTDYLGINHTFMNIDSAVSEREFLRQLYCFEELWGNPQVPMMELYKKEREIDVYKRQAYETA